MLHTCGVYGPGFEYWHGQVASLVSKTSRPALGPPSIYSVVAEVLSLGQSSRSVCFCSSPAGSKVKNAWSYASVEWTGRSLVFGMKHCTKICCLVKLCFLCLSKLWGLCGLQLSIRQWASCFSVTMNCQQCTSAACIGCRRRRGGGLCRALSRGWSQPEPPDAEKHLRLSRVRLMCPDVRVTTVQ